ncbi:MAG: hypothetical protein JWM47_3033 [Acidimicrobiales bacterium]|nr:hypothetical protein [Acidimicrobiales bacterium]
MSHQHHTAARTDRIQSRRRRAIVASAALLFGAASIAGLPTAAAEPDDIAAPGGTGLADACRAAFEKIGTPQPGGIIATHVQPDRGLLVYERGASCLATRDGAGQFFVFNVTGIAPGNDQLEQMRAAVSPKHPVVINTGVTGGADEDHLATLMWGVRHGSAASIEVTLPDGQVVSPTTNGDIWMISWPGYFDAKKAHGTFIRAYDQQGRLLAEHRLDDKVLWM